jgi:Flp pilus assembly pilin Flp
MKKANEGLTAVEYSLLIMVIVAALWGGVVYMKRAISGSMRSAGDTFGQGRQYEPP